jgi:hypothetical protein
MNRINSSTPSSTFTSTDASPSPPSSTPAAATPVAADGIDAPRRSLPVLSGGSEPNPFLSMSNRPTLGTSSESLTTASLSLAQSADARRALTQDTEALSKALPGAGSRSANGDTAIVANAVAIVNVVAIVLVVALVKVLGTPEPMEPVGFRGWESAL